MEVISVCTDMEVIMEVIRDMGMVVITLPTMGDIMAAMDIMEVLLGIVAQ